jgi:hypothetical protein
MPPGSYVIKITFNKNFKIEYYFIREIMLKTKLKLFEFYKRWKFYFIRVCKEILFADLQKA